MADGDIDLYADDLEPEFNQDGDYNHDATVDLYDDVITAPSGEDQPSDELGISSDTPSQTRPSSTGSSSPHRHHHHHHHHHGKRVAVYVGNLTWWTTDQDVTDAINSLGVTDIVEIKFYENRANGQSKGFCVVALGSDSSFRLVLDKLPKKELHGQNPLVTPCNRQNLNHFEMQSRKGGQGGMGRSSSVGQRGMSSGEMSRRRSNQPPHQSQQRVTGPPMRPPPQQGPPQQCLPGGMGRSNSVGQRGMTSGEMSRRRSNQPPYQSQQRITGPPIGPPPPQGPPPQYPPGPPSWMTGPPPQIHQGPPPPSRPGPPPIGAPGGPPPPPGIQGPPPPRPGAPLPPGGMRMPPPRGPLPPVGPRGPLPPDPRGPPPPPQHDWDRPPISHPPPQPVGPPPGQPGMPPNRPPPPVPAPGPGMPPSLPPPATHPPAPHINPAFFPPHSQAPPGPPPTSQPGDIYSRPPPIQFADYRGLPPDRPEPPNPSISEGEFEEIMNRNRTVSSSAIGRAVADASAGDYASAIETLVTAISLIKQSKVANDERCKILISSLQDTLHGIESKSYGSRSKDRPRSRERERSRERSSRREKSSRRDRSRSRDRDYRERSRERDRYHEDRYREKDRDRDRDRDHRSSRH